ncbi:MAG: AI-2E family transporter [Bifidobacteriaceae bacterium]|nr:AI-2E family transporter [Bifidobacteriaceae bacterium]
MNSDDAGASADAGRLTARETAPSGDGVPRWLRVPAGYAWRLLILAAAVVVVAKAVQGLELVAVALFLALVISAILRPLVGVLDRVMPRPLAAALGFIAGIGVLGGLGTFVGMSVAGQARVLSAEFIDGIDELNAMLARAPSPISDLDLTKAGQSLATWLEHNQQTIITEAVARAGEVAEVVTALILAIFCAVFFVTSGGAMWRWFLAQLSPGARRRWRIAGESAWHTFSGYTRGIVIVAATNGLFAGLGLAILGVPLAAPIGVLVFLGTFVPLIGAAVAMIVAVVVALAAKGVVIALVVIAMIAVIGQIEGHLLQPMIMARQVSLHPVVVAVVVVAGTLLSGILGAVAAVPIVSVMWAVFSHLRQDARATAAPG